MKKIQQNNSYNLNPVRIFSARDGMLLKKYVLSILFTFLNKSKLTTKNNRKQSNEFFVKIFSIQSIINY